VQVVRFSALEQLAPLAVHWDRLSRGVPFRGFAWMSGWWRHYGLSPLGRRRKLSLFTLAVLDDAGTPVGIAPWYCRPSASQGRVVRFLGLEEVCGDYLSILCHAGMEEPVAAALADWLAGAGRQDGDRSAAADPDGWDLLELTGVDAEDAAVACLADHLTARHHTVHRRNGPNCWRIRLPDTWDKHLAALSKSHRKQLRRTERNLLAAGRVAVHLVQHKDELDRAQQILIDLHQRRRRSLGQPGCFASHSFVAFHRDVMPKLLSAGQLSLSWMELDGRPLAAEYHLLSPSVVYAYQSGVDPGALDHSPGQLSNLVAIRRAVERGYRVFDFLRGDEPYKAHWRAEPRASVEIRVAAAWPAARLRHGLWLAGSTVKQWFQSR